MLTIQNTADNELTAHARGSTHEPRRAHSRLLWQCKLAVAANRVDDAAAHYRALEALDAESPGSMEVLASLASAFGRQREQGAEVRVLTPVERQAQQCCVWRLLAF